VIGHGYRKTSKNICYHTRMNALEWMIIQTRLTVRLSY
jgi:hypothetical protein